ncbi:MAG: PAS domain-containing sensor histidine kinase [Bacteroidetes bacterium]|nr:PAS domain-containing sensor histidine kinase [Bacteroidota bacterium]
MKRIQNFEKVLEFAPDAMIIVNKQGIIELANQQAEKIFGYPKNELIGNAIEMLIPDRFKPKHGGHRNGYFASPHVRPMGSGIKLYGKRKDGSEFPVEISLSPIEEEELVAAAIRDVTEKTKLSERFENLLESAPDAMVIVNKQGVIELVNLQTEKMFGFSRTELIGQKVEILMPQRFANKHPGHRGNFFENPHVRPMGTGLKLFGRKKDNSEFPIEISLSPIEKEGLVAAAIRDVTQRFMTDYLMAKNKQLEDFAYITSHNLRSPVSNLNSLLQFYKNEKTEEGRKIMFDKFEITVQRLGETLNNLMDVLVIQHGNKPLISTVYFENVFFKIKSGMEIMINDANAHIETDFKEAPSVEYSTVYLESIMYNLINNALKYSSVNRKPIIRVKTSIKDGKVMLTVSDNGMGIDLNKHGNKLFGLNKVFHKHPDAKGVGLFITKTQIESMGGQITAECEPDKGCTFRIIF